MSVSSWSMPAPTARPPMVADPNKTREPQAVPSTPGPSTSVPSFAPPSPGVVAPIAVDGRLPRRVRRSAPALWVLGAHGGAAETTIAATLRDASACEHAWPSGPGVQAPVLLTARTTMAGLRAVQRALADWASGQTGVRLAGVVLVADAPGHLPRHMSVVVATLESTAPKLWRLPWSAAWRASEAPDTTSAERRLGKALADLAGELNLPLDEPSPE